MRVLHLAASTMQTRVESALEALLLEGLPFDYAAVRDRAGPHEPAKVPDVRVPAPDLAQYDQLLEAFR